MPFTFGILTSMNTMSGPRGARERDRLRAVARLADDLVALFLEHLAQVHADQRLVLGDQYAHAPHLLVVVVTYSPRPRRAAHGW